MRRKISYISTPVQADSIPSLYIFDLESTTENNRSYKYELWSGEHMNIYAMSIERGEDIGPEVHYENDQIIFVTSGRAKLETGRSEGNMSYERIVNDDEVIVIPSGLWHNITSIGNETLKLLTVYSPPNIENN